MQRLLGGLLSPVLALRCVCLPLLVMTTQFTDNSLIPMSLLILLYVILQLPAIEQSVKEAGHTILTPLVSLDTPGKATVEVVILADPVSQNTLDKTCVSHSPLLLIFPLYIYWSFLGWT